MELRGADILVKSLEAEGVDTIFGYPGGQVLNIYDALYDCNLNHVLTRHEQGAAHAADGYARATGKPGVCLATSGPGGTNLVTGLANAYMDSVPMVAFTGQVPTAALGRDSFQEADITGITLPITKHNYLVKNVKDLAQVIKEAFYIATTGRPGPVLIDIPSDISANVCEFEYPETLNLRGYQPNVEAAQEQINEAAKAIAAAQRPVIYAGGGVINADACAELKQLADLTVAPVTTSLMGKGCFPEDHPLSLGMIGMHGTSYANYAVCECDLLIAVGARFSNRVTGNVAKFAPEAKIIHIDIDPAEIGKNVRVDVRVVGNLKNALTRLNERIAAKMANEWQDKIALWKKEYPLSYNQDCGIKPQYVIQQISELTKHQEAKICTEVGQHQMWASHYYTATKPRSFITSGGLGTMGYGFPASIGAQVGCPDATVFNIAGDGSIQMNIQELATCVQYELPINVAILNNGYLGMVRQWQELFYKGRYSSVDLTTSPNFVKVAEAYGAEGIKVTNVADVKPALEQAMASSKPVFMDFIVEKEENVFPMVPPGGTLNKMIGG